jgi:hypothetical protein
MRTRSLSRLKAPLLSRPVIHLERWHCDVMRPACGVDIELVRGMTNVREFTTCVECRRVSEH